jgi:hypothetical protein
MFQDVPENYEVPRQPLCWVTVWHCKVQLGNTLSVAVLRKI